MHHGGDVTPPIVIEKQKQKKKNKQAKFNLVDCAATLASYLIP